MNKNTNPAEVTPAPVPLTAEEARKPGLVERIGNTTFDIFVHFSETSKETFTDKVLRLIQKDGETE